MTLIIALSGLGFSGFLALDLPFVRKSRLAGAMVALVATAALAIAFSLATQRGDHFAGLAGLEWLGAILTLAGGALTVYSALIEIPLTLVRRARRTTMQSTPSAPGETNALVQSGTYALCRHPGFLWILFFLLGLVLLFNRSGLVELALCWAVMDLVLVGIQDQVVFPRLFVGYSQYQRKTPFIVPSLTSLRTAIKSLRGQYE